MSPNTVIGILNYKKQLDQDNASRAAEAQANLPDRPRTTGTYGPLASAVSANISGDQVPVTPMANPPVAGGVAKSNYDEPASEIQQYPDLPTQPQLDRSNLAGPVATNLTPPPGCGQRPRLVTGMPVEEGAAPPIGYNGGQLINAQDYDYLHPPVQPGFDRTRGGKARPDLATYEQSLDSENKHIGKMARFGAGFKQGVRGGLINGLIGGVVDLANPGAGNKAVYENDTGEFDAQKQSELAQERSDPYYQNQLQSQQLRMDQPVKLQTYQAQQQAELLRQKQLADVNNQARLEQIRQRGTNQQAAITTRQQLKNTGDLEGLKALYTGMIDPDTGKPFTAADADQAARSDLLDQKNAKTEKIWSQQNLANSRAGEIDAITKNLPQKFADAHKKVQGYLDNVQTNAGRLKLQQGNADQRTENDRQLRQGAALQSELNTLEADHKAQYAVINNPYNSTPDKQPLIDAARKRIAEIDGRINEINSQRLDTTGAPRRGQPATKPGATGPTLSTGHKKDDIVTVGGKQVRITKVHPDGKTFDYEEIH